MKKIGIILQSTTSTKYLYDTLNELSKCNQVEIFFLMSFKENTQQRFWKEAKSKGFFRVIELYFFRLMIRVEYNILSLLYPHLRGFKEVLDINPFNKNEIIHLKPIFSNSGFNVSYSDIDIDKVKALDLDIIIRGNAFGIFKGKILSAAKDGIISFHHGDNRWNRGGPAAFWEVYMRKSSTGFVIQRLTEELDGGHILCRGNIQTRRTYTENIINLLEESNPCLSKLVLDYVREGKFLNEEERLPFAGSLFIAPAISKSISYSIKTFYLFFKLLIRKGVLKKEERWSVAFIKAPWREAILRKGIKIQNPSGRYFADPFVITKDNRTVCFVEDFSHKKGLACISAIEIFDDNSYNFLGSIIEESFHMSFPSLLEYQGELYMVPETFDGFSVRLYKCIEFPLKWEYQYNLLNNIHTVDSLIFQQKEKWWLFTNVSIDGKANPASKLMAYYSDNPISTNWIPHEGNPIIYDSNIARNGGILDGQTEFPIRVRQKQGFNTYGAALSLAKVAQLDTTSYKEEEIKQVVPDFFPNLKGCHHFHSNGNFTVYDFLRHESIK